MTIKRSFRVLSLLMSAGMFATGCSGDDNGDTVITPGPGVGGSGGSGGSGGAGGSGTIDMGQGGSAAAGAGGTQSAGSGGTQSAGSGGSSGSGGCAFEMCSGKCVDTKTSAENCGACGQECPTGLNQMATCTGGVCGTVCKVGFADCDPNVAGCEKDVSSDVNNCGTCGNVCKGSASVPAQCVVGSCQLACPPGKQDCNGNVSDGCESDKNSDANNCGSCGNVCAGSVCVAGGCACAGTSEVAKMLPLDLYIIMDESRSMADLAGKSGKSKWVAVKEAISSFVQDPKSNGLGVGIKYFPTRESSLPTVCSSEAQCGSYGPCMPLSGCSNSKSQVTECIVDNDCNVLGAGGKCIPLGLCSNNDDYACFPTLSGSCSGNMGSCIPLEPFCQFETCSVSEYATPAVAISALPSNAANIISSMNAQVPLGGTPTKPALDGAVQYASSYAQANPRHTVVILLATDGMPNDCSSTIENVAATALSASQQSPNRVLTFVIGVFGDSDIQSGAQTNLDKIAKAGGGKDSAFVISTSQDVTQEFLAALNSIREGSLSCTYEIPKPDTGTFDPQMLNVLFTPGGGGTSTVPYVTSAAGCSAQGGWHYDDPANPTKIIACPQTCTAFQQGSGNMVEIQLGCATTKP